VTAYEELVRRYQELAFRVAYTILGTAVDAEDAAQEGFVRAYRALGRFRAGAPFRPWLVTIVANASRNRRVAAARHTTLELTAALERPADERATSPEMVALSEEQRRELLAAVNTLRDDDRQVIACRYFLDLSEAETADALGCARGTVKSRLSRALGRLRVQLAASGDLAARGSDG
jgi:RNA polymerase sigma-70 factor (ECF subfamily)